MAFDVETTDEARDCYLALCVKDQQAIGGAIDLLDEKGPALGRPAVDTITSSRHQNMKELRSFGGQLRALFVFDPRRSCCSAATSAVTGAAGMSATSRAPTIAMTTT